MLPRNAVIALIMRYASRLKYPRLFTATLVLFLLDLVIPDLVPFADEILLGLVTMLLGGMKKERQAAAGPAQSNPGPDAANEPEAEEVRANWREV